MQVKNYIELLEALNSGENIIELVNSINAVNTIKLTEGQKIITKKRTFF
ncbi:hypothetical protein [Eubacterium callanderi]